MLKDLFTGQSICLAAPKDGDAAVMAAWQDSDYLRNIDTDIARPKTEEELAKPPEGAGELCEFRIRRREDDALVGFVALHSIEWKNQTAQLSIGIGPAENRGKGYGAQALALMLQYAFWELGLHRVGLDAIAYNAAALALYKKLGFVEEGRLRQAVYRDGNRFDRVYMGITRPEWEATQGNGRGGNNKAPE